MRTWTIVTVAAMFTQAALADVVVLDATRRISVDIPKSAAAGTDLVVTQVQPTSSDWRLVFGWIEHKEEGNAFSANIAPTAASQALTFSLPGQSVPGVYYTGVLTFKNARDNTILSFVDTANSGITPREGEQAFGPAYVTVSNMGTIDRSPPKLLSIAVVGSQVAARESFQVRLAASDEGSGFDDYSFIEFQSLTGEARFGDALFLKTGTLEAGTFEVRLLEPVPAGRYSVVGLGLRDKVGNKTFYGWDIANGVATPSGHSLVSPVITVRGR